MDLEWKREIPPEAELAVLYRSVGWKDYAQNVPKLLAAAQKSLAVLAAWDRSVLAGWIRAVGDGETILYIQDLLVQPDRQRRGIGRELVQRLCADFPQVRQKVLLTDNTPRTAAFYRSLGFFPCGEGGMLSFVRFDG